MFQGILRMTALSFALVAILGWGLPVHPSHQVEEKIPLKVQYVGKPDSERGRAFTAFLEANFAECHATDRGSLKSPEDSVKAFEQADVVVVDTRLEGVLPAGYSKPMVLLSGPGVKTAVSQGAKLDWL